MSSGLCLAACEPNDHASACPNKPDLVNHPPHYKQGTMEVIDVIENFKLPYHLGNTLKYILRAGKKDPAKTIEDLQKARWYLDRYIQQASK